MFKRKCKITFISHGSTVYSEEDRVSDSKNYPPLNEVGYREIEKICDFLKQRGIKNDKIYCSPALRTIQSAHLISKVFKKDAEILEDLTSLKYGELSGLTIEQIEEKYPNLWEKYHENICSFFPEGGEKILEFNNRIFQIIESIVEKNVFKRVIIVTHPEIIQSVVCTSLKMLPENQAKIYIKTGSATQISYFDNWASLIYSGYVPL